MRTRLRRRLLAPALALLGCGGASETIPLWGGAAPGSEARCHEAERVGPWWVENVHAPSLTVFRPSRLRRSGSAVIILPGGGHARLVYGPEGVDPARFFASRGVTAFVLKYRLAHEANSPYTLEKHVRDDVLRALALVRARAADFGVDAARVGMMGFSAGAEAASFAVFEAPPAVRPSFFISIYPGAFGIPERAQAPLPQSFALTAFDDEIAVEPVERMVRLYRNAGASLEAHFFATGGHGFNMGERAAQRSVRAWPERLAHWLLERGITQP